MAYDVTMELAGVDLGANFPTYGRAFQYIRPDDQGSAIKRVSVTLSGFVDSTGNAEVMALYEAIRLNVENGDTTFNYRYVDNAAIEDDIILHDDQPCWIEAYNEPSDNEFAKNSVGDYSIVIYWFEDCEETVGIDCTYITTAGTHTFEKTPKWSRRVTQNRPSHRAALNGSTAEITLEGTLIAEDHETLAAKIDALRDALALDGELTYGEFSQTVRITSHEISPVTPRMYAIYRITFMYDTGTIIKLSKKTTITRIHNNPVITEQPYCDSRLIELMNSSAQTITYNISVTAASITVAREQLAIEAANMIIIAADMIELSGGQEVWDEDEIKVDATIIKFYPTPVVLNTI